MARAAEVLEVGEQPHLVRFYLQLEARLVAEALEVEACIKPMAAVEELSLALDQYGLAAAAAAPGHWLALAAMVETLLGTGPQAAAAADAQVMGQTARLAPLLVVVVVVHIVRLA